MHAVGVDIGGTKIAVGVVDEEGQILAKTRRPTHPEDPESIDLAIADAVAELGAEYAFHAIGLAAAGFVAADRRRVIFAPNIAWREYPLADRVAAAIGRDDMQVVVENDANAAGWAEFAYGPARHASSMIMLTIGTGLGGAIISDGRLVRGSAGFAAEIGHMRVVPNGHPCGCGHRGCWEQYASGSALVREAKRAASERTVRAAGLIKYADGDPSAIMGPHVTKAAAAGDELGMELLNELGQWIGIGAASLSAVLDPEMYVVGGGVVAAGDMILESARSAYAANLSASAHRPIAPIVAASMGNDAGIVGAAALARVDTATSHR